ncbi:MAG: hypothetical protein K2Y18_03295 [Alphaproteobacteria bacterium]|jgi:hypothetical protein|nr:hypothetical protein [Alphaproteobacteria bacterium]
MLLKKLFSTVLSLCFLLQSLSPCFAMQLDTVENIDARRETLRRFSSAPAKRTFRPQMGRTASGILHYDQDLIHLARRTDSQNKEKGYWGNYGGSSDEQRGDEPTLAHTASFESDEESNHLYCHHPLLLQDQPFIDTYTGSLLHRLYWQQVQRLDEKVFLDRLQNAPPTGREVTDVIWVKASLLLEAVQSGNPMITVQEDKTIEVYPELFTTLSTPAGIIFLESLQVNKKINRFSRKVRPFINRLYLVGSGHANNSHLAPMPSNNWPEVVVDPGALPKLQALAQENMRKSPIPIRPVQLEDESKQSFEARCQEYKDRWIYFWQNKDSYDQFQENNHEAVSFDTPEDSLIFSKAVSAHLGALIDLKQKFSNNSTPEVTNEGMVSFSNMFLKINLGPDYKTPEDFVECLDPQDAADTRNVGTFFDLYYGQDGKSDGKRDVTALASDRAVVKSILKWERSQPSWQTFYHATTQDLHSIFQTFTSLRQFMRASFLEGPAALRGTDIYFKGVKTMADVIRMFGYQDYDRQQAHQNPRQNLILCANFFLLAGFKNTLTTSSSLEYLMNNHCVKPPELSFAIQEALALCGFGNPTNIYFESLFQQFIANAHKDHPNSVMLALQVNPEIFATHTYPAYGGGSPYTREGKHSETETTLTTQDVCDNVKAEHDRQNVSPEHFDQAKDQKRNLVPEVRILLHPDIMFDPKNVRVKAFNRFAWKEGLEQKYKRQMHLVSLAMVAEWLSEGNSVMVGCFQDYPVAKRLHQLIYRGVTGHELAEKASAEGLLHLVRHGHVAAVKEYLDIDPEIFVESEHLKETFLFAALKSNCPDMLRFLFEDLKERLELKLTRDELSKWARICLDSRWLESYNFIIGYIKNKQLGFNDKSVFTIHRLQQPKDIFSSLSDRTDPTVKIAQLVNLFKIAPQPEGLKEYVRAQIFSTKLIQIAGWLFTEIFFPKGWFTPREILNYLHGILVVQDSTSHCLPHQLLFLQILKCKEGEEPLLQVSDSGSPYLFDLIDWKNRLCRDLVDYLKTQTKIFQVRNSKGLRLLGAFQQGYLEGRSATALSEVTTLCLENGFSIKEDSYPPYLDLFGKNPRDISKYWQVKDPMSHSENRQWTMKLASLQPGQDLNELRMTCPDARLLDLCDHKIKKLQLMRIFDGKIESHRSKMYAWRQELLQALRAENGQNDENETNESRSAFDIFSKMWGRTTSEDGLNNQFQMLGAVAQIHKQFPRENENSFFQGNKKRRTVLMLLSDIPKGMTTQYVKTPSEYWTAELDESLEEFPQFAEVKTCLAAHERKWTEDKEEWLRRFRTFSLTEANPEIYAHMAIMPPLHKEEEKEVMAFINKYLQIFGGHVQYADITGGVSSYVQFLEKNWCAMVATVFTKITCPDLALINELLNAPHNSKALRSSLNLFLTKPCTAFVPQILKRLYPGGASEFAEETDFCEKDGDSYFYFRHPFTFALHAENPVDMVLQMQAFLDPKDAPKLLYGFETAQFISLIKTKPTKDLRLLTHLVPWLFLWQHNDEDFFLASIQFLPKPALSILVTQNLKHLRKTEWKSRGLPYFVHLMMSGENASIIEEAVSADPDLLTIESEDGLTMEDFLNFYAAPPVVKVIRKFQGDK